MLNNAEQTYHYYYYVETGRAMAKLASPGLERPVEAVPHCSNSSTKNSLPGVTARAW